MWGCKVGAVLYKNFLLRKGNWISTLLLLLFSPLFVALLNYNLKLSDPVLYKDVALLHYKQSSGAYHVNKIVYQPETDGVKSLLSEAATALGYKMSSISAAPMNTSKADVIYGFDFKTLDSSLTYSVYPRLPRWPHSLQNLLDNPYSDYIEDFLQHQIAVDSTFIISQGGLPISSVNLTSVGDVSMERTWYGVILVSCFYFLFQSLASNIIGAVVAEKETGAKELMVMMGVKCWESWLAKFLEGLILLSFSLVLMIIFIYIPLSEGSAVMHLVGPMYFVTVCFFGFVAMCWMLFWLSCSFDNQIMAALMSSFLAFIAYFLILSIKYLNLSKFQHLLLCLLPYYSVFKAIDMLTTFEAFGKNVKWLEILSPKDGASLANVITMMIVDTIIFAILTWYQDKVTPGKYGIPQPLGFFLNKSYWTQNKVTSETQPLSFGNSSKQDGIKIRNLRKVFKMAGVKTVAVDDVSMDVPKGQITALLGHNGAGKSTTMSIITGLIPASSGVVEVNGHDIRNNLLMARKSLGLCPQQDFLFRGLNPLQILTFYGMVKGLSRPEAIKESNDLLERLKMTHAKGTLSENLSGGMKRKVSLGIAIIGGSKVLVLDEPTSGVDPELRREISDLLLSYRGEKTILITTHIMEEADAVSDHIVILDKGRVVCAGTSMDLKLKFGTGYTLSVVVPNGTGRGDKILNAVKSTVPGSTFKGRNGQTLTFQLPELATSTFPPLFSNLDIMQKSGGILSYGVSISTLEDVFLRVREEEKLKMDLKVENLDEVDASPYQVLKSTDDQQKISYSGMLLLTSQLSGLLIKKCLQFWRSFLEYVIFILFSLALIFLLNIAEAKLPQALSGNGGISFEVLNASTPLYSGMTIFVGYESGCTQCLSSSEALMIVAKERGFLVNLVNDTAQATSQLFHSDYHYFSKFLLASINFNMEEVSVLFGKASSCITALNLVDNAFLRAKQQSGNIVTYLNLSYVGEKDLVNEFLPTQETKVPFLSSIQTYFYISSVLLERSSGAKELQLMAVPVAIYWLSHLLFDLLTMMPYMVIVLLVYWWGLDDHLMNDLWAVPVPLLFWAASLIMISYLITFFIETKMNAIFIAYLVYILNASVINQLVNLNVIDEWWGYLHPSNLWWLYFDKSSDKFLYMLIVYSIIMFSLLVIIDSKILGRITHCVLSFVRQVKYTPLQQVGRDVLEEEQQASVLMAERPANVRESLVVSKLRRWYGILRAKPAVRGVSFRVNPGECFGLLGVNGAGKTTTFNMLTGRIAVSGGDAIINRQHLNSYCKSKYISQIGYCPQSAAVIPELTGREMLEFFGRLRGLKKPGSSQRIDSLLRIMDLEYCQHKRCGKYSGGMERKLSTAIAFLWSAPVVMLDEPTSGVDPMSRRCIWEAVTAGQKAGQAIVLTSHSMTECEVLCSRLAIMVGGSFKCIGETITLKNKFGMGYSVMIKIGAASTKDILALKRAVSEAFVNRCTLTEHHSSILHYRVSEEGTSWGTLFSNLENLKSRYTFVESYTASETTLEEIFLSFAGLEVQKRSPKEEITSIV